LSDSIFDRDYFDSGKPEAGSGHFSEYAISALAPYFNSLASRLVSELNPGRILDLGCAKGFLVYAFRKLGVESYGVDISSYALSNAPPEVRSYLFQNDLEHDKLPFSDKTFDLIIASGVLEWLSNYNFAISEAQRTLKDGAAFLMIADFSRASNPKYRRYRVSVYNKHFWVKVFKEHGFELIEGFSKNITDSYTGDLFTDALEHGHVLKHFPRKIAQWIFMERVGRNRVWLLFRLEQRSRSRGGNGKR